MTDKHKKIIGVCAIIFFLGFMAAVFWFVGRPMIAFVEDPAQFRSWVDGKGLWGQLAFVVMFFFQILVAIIPGEPLEICAGYAFGAIEGTFLSMLGIALGSAAVFMLVRTLGVKLVEVFFSVEKIRSMRFLRESRKRNMLTFLLMFIPGTPKDLLSYFVGLMDMKLSEWLIITTVARIPSVVTSTAGGSALAEQNYLTAAIVFGVTGIISITGILIYNKVSRRKENKRCKV